MPHTLRLRFDARTHPDPARRLDAWKAASAPSAVPILTAGQAEALEGRIELHPLGDLLLAEIAATPQTLVRDRGLIAGLAYDHVILDVFVAGGCRGEIGGRTLAIREGDSVMFDLRGTMRLRMEAFHLRALIMPRRLLRPQSGPMPAVDGLVFRAGTPEAQLLSTVLAELLAQLPRLSEASAAAFGRGVAGLIAACTAETAGGRSGRGAAEPSAGHLRRYLERHAADPAFGPARLASAFGISRTALYRAFRREGGVAEAIRRVRATRAVGLLRDPAWSGRTTQDVARACGFADARVLRRALQDIYGVPPTRLRGHAPGRDVPGVDADEGRQRIETLLARL